MRTTDERMAQIQKRTAQLKAEREKKKQHGLDFLCAAACLVFIVGLDIGMPDFVGSLSGGGVLHTSGAASLIGDSAALGYILMGVLSFLLGVCCTVLLYRLRRRKKHGEDSDEL